MTAAAIMANYLVLFWRITRTLPDTTSGPSGHRGKNPTVDVSHHAPRARATTATIAKASVLVLKLNMKLLVVLEHACKFARTNCSNT